MANRIKDWSEEDRPRERLEKNGAEKLSSSELLAILLRTGSKNRSAMTIAREMLLNMSLEEIGRSSVDELAQIKGVGKTKAITIHAAIELGRRYQLDLLKPKQKMNQPDKIAAYFIARYCDYPVERFIVILLNHSNFMIDYRFVTSGLVSETLVHPREVFAEAIKRLSSKIILLHNHPSGKLLPSQADIDITRQMVHAGKLLGIPVMDHIIISQSGYYSFRSHGLIDE
ncbi:MAG: DNA repair protein RadC [Calditrichaeota bacterium]|nr:DNA repair protein RadC [Calditrichota bacterium]